MRDVLKILKANIVRTMHGMVSAGLSPLSVATAWVIQAVALSARWPHSMDYPQGTTSLPVIYFEDAFLASMSLTENSSNAVVPIVVVVVAVAGMKTGVPVTDVQVWTVVLLIEKARMPNYVQRRMRVPSVKTTTVLICRPREDEETIERDAAERSHVAYIVEFSLEFFRREIVAHRRIGSFEPL